MKTQPPPSSRQSTASSRVKPSLLVAVDEQPATSSEAAIAAASVRLTGAPVVVYLPTEAHRRQITERFYAFSHEIPVQFGEGYAQYPRFAATYEAIEPGLTVFVRDAIRAKAVRATS